VCRDYSSPGRGVSTTTTSCVWVPRHAARLVVDYFDYTTRPGASARHAAHRTARRRLLDLHRAFGCLSTSCGSSSTTSTTSRVRVPRHVARLVAPLVVNYTYVARLSALARHAARLTARRRLRLRRASGCLGMSRGWSRRLSSTSSPTSRVRVPRHVARLVTRLVVDYSLCRHFILRPHWLYFSHAVRRDYLSRGNTGSTSSMPRATATSSSGRIASTIHLN
jgi:hypothetical protein